MSMVIAVVNIALMPPLDANGILSNSYHHLPVPFHAITLSKR